MAKLQVGPTFAGSDWPHNLDNGLDECSCCNAYNDGRSAACLHNRSWLAHYGIERKIRDERWQGRIGTHVLALETLNYRCALYIPNYNGFVSPSLHSLILNVVFAKKSCILFYVVQCFNLHCYQNVIRIE